MNPGDVIKWVYKYNNIVVHENENLWSTSMNQWVPIDVPALLISYTKDEYSWLSEKGLFHARKSDMWGVSIRLSIVCVCNTEITSCTQVT